METHWDRTWRRFSEAFEKQRRRDMNETRRDALVEKVTGILDARSQLTATELSHRDICQDANELVEAVTRHRDAEIREAMRRDKTVGAIEEMLMRTHWANASYAKAVNAIEIMETNIGLAEEGEE